jgi:xanthine dehydrogenase accessory factor
MSEARPISQSSDANLWQQISAAAAQRRPVVVATVVRDSGSVPRRAGAKMLVFGDGGTAGSVGGGLFEILVIRDALACLPAAGCTLRHYSFNPTHTAPDAFGAVCGGEVDILLEVVMPPDRLLIVGGGHCGRALAQAASLLDFSIIVADDRAEFSRAADFPFAGVEQVLRVAANFAELPVPDDRTYVVLVTRGFATDEAALRRVLDSPAAYLGMIGSGQKRDHVYANLRASGIAEEKLGRVHCPVGLEIGADTPGEIAVSILAEIIQVRAGRRAEARPAPRGKEQASDVAR